MGTDSNRTKLLIASFLTLIASGFGFATRASVGGVWGSEFGISGTQFGAIMGAGFLGFGIMIFFGGILTEKFGYKALLGLAFLLHLVSAGMLLVTPSMFEGWREADPATATENVFNMLFWSAFLFSICQGLYEAVINPLVGQLYPENQTHYLNILHAGWPGGMILGGLFAVGFIGDGCLITELPWQISLASFAIIVVAYGIMAFPEKFPKTVSATGGGSFGQVFSCFTSWPFLLLVVIHAMIGYMELGVDSWVTKIMELLMDNPVVLLVYTSALMFVLRFFAGPIVHKLNPIGLLFASSVIACGGLFWLGSSVSATASVGMLLVAMTVYSLGKAFLWPTMLAVAGERYPQSGAVAMGTLGAAGMLTVGLIGGPAIGAKQASHMSEKLEETAPETFERYAKADAEPFKVLGITLAEFRQMVPQRLQAANSTPMNEDGTIAGTEKFSKENAELIEDGVRQGLIDNAAVDVPKVREAYFYGGNRALVLTAAAPALFGLGFLILLVYYKSQGGYKVIHLTKEEEGHVPEPAAGAQLVAPLEDESGGEPGGAS